MKNIGKSLLWLYGFIANLITYIQGLEKTLDWLNERFPELISYVIVSINTILLVFLLFYIPLLLFIYATLPYRKTIGTHKIECKPFNLFRYKFINKNGKLLKVVHRGIYHQSYKIKEDIRKGRVLDKEQLQDRIGDFLKYVGLSLKDIFSLSLSINVKLLSYSSDKSLLLSPCIQVSSSNERSGLSSERNLTNKYIVLLDNRADLKNAFSDAKHYDQHDTHKTYRVNSVFNFLMNSKKKYWMSNDLSKDMSEKFFFTSSDNYPIHYNSFAVFKIAPPERDVMPEGLLIFDTIDKGRFVEEECSQLMGFVAHLLYELFLEYYNYEQKKETERKEALSEGNNQRERSKRHFK